MGLTPEACRTAGAGLADVVGEAYLLDGDRAGPFAVDGHVPRWVAFPGSVDEVSGCLAVADSRGLAVAPTGHGTRLGWGNPPRALDLVLSLRRLDRVLAHEPADLTLSVEAGVTLGALQARLGPYRQLLPLDPARAAASTVGGVVATAASGPYRARYGTIRDLLLGLTVVQADGTVVKGGGRVVKNVTGYDMPKLHVGALGTLGVIVAAHLRVHPMAASEATWLFGFPTAEAALDAALGLMDAPLVLSRLELLDRTALVRLGHPAPPAAAVAATIGSVPEGVRAQGERIGEICRRTEGAAVPVPEPDGWWRRVSDASLPPEPAALALRIGTRPTDVVKALRGVEAAGGGRVAPGVTAEIANGVLHVVLAGSAFGDAVALVRRIRDAVAPLGASCVVEHAPPDVKPSLDVWGDVGQALPVMRRLKAEVDPRGTLNPGRFVGAI